MNTVRVVFVGGLTSYRALFHWLSPWIYVPIMLVYPLFQIIFFAYLGRGVSLESDRFFLIGNGIQITAVAGLFGMAQVMGNERWFQTLPALLGSPASRLALFLGRSLPTMANAILGVHVPASAFGGLALATVAAAFACTALGLCIGALGLRGRNVSVFADVITACMLVVSGANVPLHRLPGWVQTISSGIPDSRVAMTGRPDANASISTTGSPSIRPLGEMMLGRINRSARCKSAATSSSGAGPATMNPTGAAPSVAISTVAPPPMVSAHACCSCGVSSSSSVPGGNSSA